MIAQKIKGNIIKLFEGECNEIESFSLLKLNLIETKRLLDTTNAWNTEDLSLICTYVFNDTTDKVWKELAIQHQKDNNNFQDVSKEYISTVEGTSILLRDPEKHIIRIAFKKNNICTINRLNIDNRTRELFFSDTKKGNYFSKTGKYALDSTNEDLYNHWSNYMNSEYLKNI